VDKRIGRILVEQGLISPEQLEEALELQRHLRDRDGIDPVAHLESTAAAPAADDGSLPWDDGSWPRKANSSGAVDRTELARELADLLQDSPELAEEGH
jgi:hypothetical protein